MAIPGPPGKTRFLDGDFAGPAWIRWFNQLVDGIAAGIGIGSINGDTTSDQVIKGAGSVTVSTSGGVTTITGAGTAGGAGLLSINSDTTAAQTLIAGTNIAIVDRGSGQHLISATQSGIKSINSDTTAAQQIVGSGGITVSTSYGITTIGGGGSGGGITSINSDSTAAQTFTAGAGITITDTGGGGHTIAATGGGASRDTSILVNTVPYSDDYFVSVNVMRPLMVNGV
jgi:hypothetical protein